MQLAVIEEDRVISGIMEETHIACGHYPCIGAYFKLYYYDKKTKTSL